MNDIMDSLRSAKRKGMEQLSRKLLGLEQLLEIGKRIACLDQDDEGRR